MILLRLIAGRVRGAALLRLCSWWSVLIFLMESTSCRATSPDRSSAAKASAQALAQLRRAALHLNDPLIVRYARWIYGIPSPATSGHH